MPDSFREQFYDSDLIVIIDTRGKVMYYENYDDRINMLGPENAVGRAIFELYPFFRREDFTVFQAMDAQKPILNQYQSFEVDGKPYQAVNSAYPLINETGVIGGIVISTDLMIRKSKKKKARAAYRFSDILTCDPEYLQRLEMLKKVAQSDSGVLIYGETGTGKELIAHAIHSEGHRQNHPFLIQNCATIPGSIMESILFGTRRGSFTGAIDREGLFEAACGGTIYLDEINSLDFSLQSKLLRVLENRTICRIGETAEREVDVRIIASTNEDLSALVDRGQFRPDLFYRLGVINFVIPPLRRRPEDIPLLVDHFIRHYNARLSKTVTGVDAEVLQLFLAFPWHGNIRELKNVMEYAFNLIDDGPIERPHLPDYLQEHAPVPDPADSPSPGRTPGPVCRTHNAGPGRLATLEEQVFAFEKSLIEAALKECRYNVLQTANRLGIPRQTLYYKLKKYELRDAPFK